MKERIKLEFVKSAKVMYNRYAHISGSLGWTVSKLPSASLPAIILNANMTPRLKEK